MIYIGAATSGAHFNPAVTLALLITKNHGCLDTIFYIAAQVVGGFFGGLMVWAVNTGNQSFNYANTYPSIPYNDAATESSFVPLIKGC